jgi:hypothetical protein
MGYYYFSIPHLVVHILHLIVGAWLVYIGYKKIQKEPIHDNNYKVLTGLGIIVTLYFLLLSYINRDKKWNYNFGVPNYLVFLVHIINGVLMTLLGTQYLKMNEIASLYLIISGSMASLYHAHLMYIH